MKQGLTVLILLVATLNVSAQDTLPNFSVINAGNNKYIIGWTNSFENVKQISIQRSFDSLKNYTTIMTVPDPMNPQNGYVDGKAANDHMFYRIYILLDKGVYLFSKPRKPVIDTVRSRMKEGRLNPLGITADSTNNGSMTIKNGNKPEVFAASKHVFTQKDGYVRIVLPENADKKYSIRFFEEDDSFLFEIKELKETPLLIDKSNFIHAGWFKFELYEEGKLKEKHKFQIQREF
jgi:hypothetical protein